MKRQAWIVAPVAGAILLAGGAGSSMAGFTATATAQGTAQAISLAQVLPLTLNSIEAPDPGKAKSGVGQPIALGSLTNDGSESYSPIVQISGVSGVLLGGVVGTLAPGQSEFLTLGGLSHLRPGSYTVTVTVQLANFTETASTQITVKKPQKDLPSKQSQNSTAPSDNPEQSTTNPVPSTSPSLPATNGGGGSK